MKKFLLVTNEDRDPGMKITASVANYIRSKNAEAYSIPSVKERSRQSIVHNDELYRKRIKRLKIEPEDLDGIMVLGGDGTFVRTSRDLSSLSIPIIGVNLGTMGYLCELKRDNVEEAVDQILKDEYMVENRMMLEGFQPVQESEPICALNDIVIRRREPTQLICLKVFVDGLYLTSYQADGIIIAAPTGSTSYNLSAGGPIVDPKAELILLTPINSHDVTARSIVIGSDSTVEVELAARRPEKDEKAVVDFDGDACVRMQVGDRIVVHRSNKTVQVLKLNKISFLQTLSKKMGTQK